MPSVRWYVQSLEEVVIKMCLIYGVKAERCKDTGVWCGNDKICAIGVHASRYVRLFNILICASLKIFIFF